MIFILITFILWVGYVFLLKRNIDKEFVLSNSLLPLILISFISTMCLGVNYVASAVPSLNDGIGIHNFLAYWIIGEGNWSVQLFRDYFNISVYISIFLTLIYSALTLVKK